jgi:uncharacterized membrane protein YgcG
VQRRFPKILAVALGAIAAVWSVTPSAMATSVGSSVGSSVSSSVSSVDEAVDASQDANGVVTYYDSNGDPIPAQDPTPEFSSWEERLEKIQIVAVVTPTGDLNVNERITWNFGNNQKRGIFRYLPQRFRIDPSLVKVEDPKREWDRVTNIRWGKVTSLTGAPTAVKVTTEAVATEVPYGSVTENSVLRIGEENRFITGQHVYDISYTIERAVVDGLLQFVAVGEGWTVPVVNVDITVKVPVEAGKSAKCIRGNPALSCALTTEGNQVKVKTAGVGVEIEVPVDASVTSPAPLLETEHLFSDGFTTKGLPGLAGLVAVVGAALGSVAIGRKGRDRVFATGGSLGQVGDPERPRRVGEKLASPVEFEPPEGIRPALIEPARTGESTQRCISALVVDLAARNVLRIEPVQDDRGNFDYVLHLVGNGQAQLSKSESDVLGILFGSGPGPIALSELTSDIHLASQMKVVRAQLRAEAVNHGWWDENPVGVRGRWRGLGIFFLIGGVIATFFTASVSRFGVAALGLIILGVGMLIFAQTMPVRSATGTRIAARLRGFELLFDAGEGDRLKLAERQNLFAEYLPYAMAFGNVDKWVKTFAAMGIQPAVPYFGPLMGYGTGYGPGYYPGGWAGGGSFDRAMNDFERSFEHSIQAGAAAEAARLAAERAESSGSSSSGGFSGGSFGGGGSSGGGGGGSW